MDWVGRLPSLRESRLVGVARVVASVETIEFPRPKQDGGGMPREGGFDAMLNSSHNSD